jgi:hypothetical protein
VQWLALDGSITMAQALQKRPNDLFISYGHADKPIVDAIVRWLQHSAGLKIWHDDVGGDASRRTTELLENGLGSSRGSLFILSSNWTASTWCKDEYDFALTERRNNDAFLVVAVRIDEVEIPPWFKLSNVLDFRQFDARSAAHLLRSMAANPPVRLDNDQDVYFAGPWKNTGTAAASALDAMHRTGWRIIGDSPDHPHFKESRQRITAIINTARGLVAVMPYDESRAPVFASPYILDEVRIAHSHACPYLLFAEEGVQIPADVAADAFGGGVIPLRNGGSPEREPYQQVLMDFDEELERRTHSDDHSYSFFATSLLAEQRDTDDLISVVERTSNMRCVLGHGMSGQHIQRAIIDRIRRAAVVIADVSDDNRNSLIEAGVALGAGTDLHLLCRVPADGSRKRRFMFEDREMNWYETPLERLGMVYRIARMYRRRVLVPR